MRVFQLLPSLAQGDAIGHLTLTLDKILRGQGCETHIYALGLHGELPQGVASYESEMPPLGPEDVILFHMSIGSALSAKIGQYPCRRVMVYHNVTPSGYFAGYSEALYEQTQQGREDLAKLNNTFHYALAMSAYNRAELLELGYTCPVHVLPFLVNFADYGRTPALDVISRYSGHTVNFMFLGRVSPNKKHQDAIAAFAAYQRRYNAACRLFLVGNWAGLERYKAELDGYADALGAQGVIFTGHVRFEEILAYYTLADIFLCMSEHEGFCVPLVEAMHFDVPVVAYAAAAVPDTLGGAGVLLDTKEPGRVARVLDELVQDPLRRREIVAGQRDRLADFSYERLHGEFLRHLEAIRQLPGHRG